MAAGILTRTRTGARVGARHRLHHRSAGALVVSMVLIGSSGLLSTAAAASPAPATSSPWTLDTTANELIATGRFTSVSCSKQPVCIAVGDTHNAAGIGVTTAASYFHSSWSLETPPDPVGAAASILGSVSCSSAVRCMAVGETITSTGNYKTLAESFHGGSWTLVPTSSPGLDKGSVLSAVSCNYWTHCLAVGGYNTTTGAEVPLAEVWNGSTWTLKPAPEPTGALNGLLSSVSCTSSTACTAIGTFQASDGSNLPFADRLDGYTWSLQTIPIPHGSLGAHLYAVSCTSISVCRSVGVFETSTGSELTMSASWNGIAWSIQATPNPAGRPGDELFGISCSSSTQCLAVGTYGFGFGTLSEQWNAGKWSLRSVPPVPQTTDDQLFSVSCNTASSCVSVGSGNHPQGVASTLAATWNGTAWSLAQPPDPIGAGQTNPSSVSCYSADACVAVGQRQIGAGNGRMLIESDAGGSWSLANTAPIPGAEGASLTGVSCASGHACTAVGGYVKANGSALTLVERWNGRSWVQQPSPNPPGQSSSSFFAVSCASATACTAVGSYATSAGGALALAEHWNGTSWSLETVPTPAGAESTELFGVSCVSAVECIAVGLYGDSTGQGQTLVEAWNGTHWSVQASPDPSGGGGNILSAVSCSSATSCMAVGSYVNTKGTGVTLAESWDGTRWTIEPTPSATGEVMSELVGVSCTSASSCTAVGSVLDPVAITSAVVAEIWDGTSWAMQPTAPLADPIYASLRSVSCASDSSCTAVGNYAGPTGDLVSLAETK